MASYVLSSSSKSGTREAMRIKSFKLCASSLLCICFVLLSLTTKGFSQGYQSFNEELSQIEENTKWRIGPFRIFPRILFRNVGYDNNVYRQHDAINPVGDFTFTLALPITAHLLIRDWMILSFTTTPEYLFFAQQERERSFNISYSPSIRMLFLRRFVLSGRYVYRQARVRATSEFDDRVEETRNEAIGQLFYETQRRTSIGFTGTIRDLKYGDLQQPGIEIRYSRELNRTERNALVELYYQVFADSFFFVNWGYGEYDFEYPESKWKDSHSYSIYSGLQFPLLGRIRGILSLGYKILEPYKSRKQSFSGIVGNVRLDYRLRRFAFRVLYARDCEFSYWTNNVFYIEDRYGAGISFYLSRNIRLDYDFSYRDSFYPEPDTVRLPDESYQEINRRDKYSSHTAGIVFRIFRSTGIGLMATYWERDSNFPYANRSQWFLGGYLTYEF